MLIPNIAKAKYSALENCNASFANCGERIIKQSELKIPPDKLANVDSPSARPGCFRVTAMGYPSKVVAADAGVPGVFSKIAEIEPPYMAPQ